MNESIRKYWEQLSQYWNQFSKSQKIMIFSIAAITLITIAVLTYNFSKTEYSLAYTNLTPSDAASIKEYLNSAGIDYKFSADGTAIGVPTKKVTEVKIDVESQNLLNSGSIGYGIFRENISGFGMSENQFNVLNLDAKAGEIEQTLRAMNGVRDVKVLLNIPQESVFINTDDPEQASASVVVNFQLGHRADQSQIDTMYNLVSKSVANLPIENITISDQNNELLPSSRVNGGIGSSANIATEQLLIKKQYELDIQKNVQSFLGKIMGPDKVIVHVVSTLNFDQKNTQETIFAPVNLEDNTGIERSIQEIQKSYTSESGEPGGVAGVGPTDIPTFPGASSGGSTDSEEVERIVNYEINEINKSIVSSPFVVEDLTIFAGIEPFIADDPSSLTEETKDQVQQMLASIIGTSLANSGKTFTEEELRSKVTVIAQPFQGKTDFSGSKSTSNLLLYSLIAVALVLGAAGGYYVFRKRASNVEEEELAVSSPASLPSLDFENVSQENQVRKQLENLAKKKPDEFVDLLRTWLVDE